MGFFYHLQELETAARYGLNVVCVVNNNEALNQEQDLWEDGAIYDRNWRFESTDFVQLAESLGCVGIRVEQPAEFPAALERAFTAGRPVVIDAKTDISARAPGPWMPGGQGAPGSFFGAAPEE